MKPNNQCKIRIANTSIYLAMFSMILFNCDQSEPQVSDKEVQVEETVLTEHVINEKEDNTFSLKLDGKTDVTIEIPRGAVVDKTTIYTKKISGNTVNGKELICGIGLEPSGVSFKKPIKITLGISNDSSTPFIGFNYNSQNKAFEFLPATIKTISSQKLEVTISTTHFSIVGIVKSDKNNLKTELKTSQDYISNLAIITSVVTDNVISGRYKNVSEIESYLCNDMKNLFTNWKDNLLKPEIEKVKTWQEMSAYLREHFIYLSYLQYSAGILTYCDDTFASSLETTLEQLLSKKLDNVILEMNTECANEKSLCLKLKILNEIAVYQLVKEFELDTLCGDIGNKISTINEISYTISINQQININSIFDDIANAEISWWVEDASVAEVTGSVLRGIGTGQTYVTGTVCDTISFRNIVNVDEQCILSPINGSYGLQVKGASGPVPGATVKIYAQTEDYNVGSQLRNLVTDDNGTVIICNLPFGWYRLRVEKDDLCNIKDEYVIEIVYPNGGIKYLDVNDNGVVDSDDKVGEAGFISFPYDYCSCEYDEDGEIIGITDCHRDTIVVYIGK